LKAGNYVIEYRWAGNQTDRLALLARFSVLPLVDAHSARAARLSVGQGFVYQRMIKCHPLAPDHEGLLLHVCARVALVSMVVASGLGLVGCALTYELKDTVSKWTSQDAHAEHVPDATGSIPPTTPPIEEETKAATTEKRLPARELQEPRIVNLPKKQPSSAPAEPAISQESAAQSPPSQSAPSQLSTPWPKAPSPGSFSR
jgi:hypothetical protein